MWKKLSEKKTEKARVVVNHKTLAKNTQTNIEVPVKTRSKLFWWNEIHITESVFCYIGFTVHEMKKKMSNEF